LANEQYELFLKELKQKSGLFLANGVFGADMKVSLVNDGPVTIWMDSQHR
jgi:D-tyrosyl-tRNA(Tyr) deacylase